MFLVVSAHSALGQDIDSVQRLESATVVAIEDHTTSNHMLSLNAMGLSELLLTEYGINIRRNSASGLSTLNYRGFSPGQTRITWNGLPINNPMNGQADLSLMPFFLIDGISLGMSSGTGKNSAFNSTVGGEMKMSSYVPYWMGNQTTFLGGIGRFGSYTSGVDAQYKIVKNIYGRSKAYISLADNNYPYYDVTGNSLRLPNAGAKLYAVMQDIQSDKFKASVWAQMADRNIPPTILEGKSFKNQKDKHVRGVVEYKPFKKRTGVKFKYGFALESIDYSDPIADIKSDNVSFNQFLTFQKDIITGKNSYLISGLDIQNSIAKTSTYGKVNPQTISTFRNVWYHSDKRKESAAGIRISTRGTEIPSVLPSLRYTFRQDVKGKDSNTIAWATHSVSYERGLRFPTLNDLYWVPGGNTKLRPEISEKVNLAGSLIIKEIRAKYEVFGALINSQIQWLPGQSGIFEATQRPNAYSANFGANLSIGSVPAVSFSREVKKFEWRLLYTFTRSFAEVRDPIWQRIYIPEHQASLKCGYTLKKFYTGLVMTYMSKRYLTTTNDDWLAPAFYMDLVMTYKWKDFSATIRGNNILGAEYYLLAYRPMPMNDYKILFTYKIHSKNDK